MKSNLVVSLSIFASALLLAACAATHNAPPAEPLNPTGTPSPLNTSANPWTNVNPQIQGQQELGRQRAGAALKAGGP